MKKTLAGLIATAALALGVALPGLAAAQPAAAGACLPGAKPVTTSYVEDLTVTHLTRAVGVVVPFHGVGTVIVDTPIVTGTVITETRNVAGVEGLIQTTISGGLGRPIVNLSVPAYLL